MYKTPQNQNHLKIISPPQISIDFKYDSENDIYIVSIDLNSSISDENAIQNFNDSIYDVIHADSKPDKDVVFRVWDGSIAAPISLF